MIKIILLIFIVIANLHHTAKAAHINVYNACEKVPLDKCLLHDGALWCVKYPPAPSGMYLQNYCSTSIIPADKEGNLAASYSLVTTSCPTGQVQDANGYCGPVPCPSVGTVKSTGLYDVGTNPDSLPLTSTCDNGCESSYSGSGVDKRAMIGGVYHYFVTGSYNSTGQSCSSGGLTPSAQISLPPNTCNPVTQQSGQVNGVTVCLEKTQTDTKNTTTSPTVTNADGSKTSTTTTTTNNTTNNTTTNNTTTTNTAPDGTVTQTTTDSTTKNPPSNFCAANPTDPTCIKNSKICEENPETLGCATLGTVSDSVVPTVEKGISDITPRTIGGAGSCPAPITTSFMGKSISISYDLPCQAAGMLKPLILAIAWLSAGLIFIGGVKQ